MQCIHCLLSPRQIPPSDGLEDARVDIERGVAAAAGVSQSDRPRPHRVVSATNEFVCISAVFWVNFVVRFGFRQKFA